MNTSLQLSDMVKRMVQIHKNEYLIVVIGSASGRNELITKILRLQSDKLATTKMLPFLSVAKLFVKMHLISGGKRSNFNIMIFSLPDIK